MINKTYKSGFLATAALAAALFICRPANGQTLNFGGRDAATVGIKIVNLSNGEVLQSENAGKAMIPASILKSVTTATSLSILGPDFRYRTKVVAEGKISGNTLKGNIVILSSGDPTIESQYFPEMSGLSDSIISNLKRLGVKEITGDIYVDEDRFADAGQNPQWVIEDVGWSYGAGNYGFNYSDNIFTIYPATMTTIPQMPDIDVVIDPTTGSLDIAHGINSDTYIISGSNLDNRKRSVETPMNSPSTVFLFNLKNQMRDRGIELQEKDVTPVAETTDIYEIMSPANSDILRSLMFRSDNMMAEATLRSLAPGNPRDAAIKAETNYWKSKGINTEYAKIMDGSGLARTDRITPDFLADVLTHMTRSNYADTYTSLFPLVGREGTVKRLLKGTALEGKLALKSGSMNGVQCFAGYKLDAKGKPTHVIVLMVNNFYCPRATLRTQIEKWLIESFK